MPDHRALKMALATLDFIGLDDAAAAAKLNADVVTTTVPRDAADADEVLEALDPAEVAGLPAARLDQLLRVLALGGGRVRVRGPNTRTILGGVLGPNSKSMAALTALQDRTIAVSRAVAIPGWGVPATDQDVAAARRMP
jgi:hypothetical protein